MLVSEGTLRLICNCVHHPKPLPPPPPRPRIPPSRSPQRQAGLPVSYATFPPAAYPAKGTDYSSSPEMAEGDLHPLLWGKLVSLCAQPQTTRARVEPKHDLEAGLLVRGRRPSTSLMPRGFAVSLLLRTARCAAVWGFPLRIHGRADFRSSNPCHSRVDSLNRSLPVN